MKKVGQETSSGVRKWVSLTLSFAIVCLSFGPGLVFSQESSSGSTGRRHEYMAAVGFFFTTSSREQFRSLARELETNLRAELRKFAQNAGIERVTIRRSDQTGPVLPGSNPSDPSNPAKPYAAMFDIFLDGGVTPQNAATFSTAMKNYVDQEKGGLRASLAAVPESTDHRLVTVEAQPVSNAYQ